MPPKTTTITEMAPTKSQHRVLPITDVTMAFFVKQFQLQQKQRELAELSGQHYYDKHLVIAKADQRYSDKSKSVAGSALAQTPSQKKK